LRDMNIANVLISQRHSKGVTQEALALHLGVSKASVSKWEKGTCYPKIELLPEIASYFDISINQLMNYFPHLSESDIHNIYARLLEDFTTKPFENVIAECMSLVKSHYQCFSFVLKITLLYINHLQNAVDNDRKIQIIQMALNLCDHVLKNCSQSDLLQKAMQYKCFLITNGAEKVVE